MAHLLSPCLHGASRRHGLSRHTSRIVLERRDPLQSIVRRAPLMMVSLISNVLEHPLQVSAPKTDHTVPCLPLQGFSPFANALVHVVRCAAFELTNPLADGERRRDGHGKMNVGIGPADFVEKGSVRIDDSFL